MCTDAHCNHSVNLKCSIRMISRKYGCEQHDDGAAFSSLYSMACVILKVSSKDFISLNVESIRMLMKGELTVFNSCSFYLSSMFIVLPLVSIVTRKLYGLTCKQIMTTSIRI